MDFWSYSAAYMYYSMSTNLYPSYYLNSKRRLLRFLAAMPALFNATTPVCDDHDDPAKLQAFLVTFNS